MDNTAHHLSKLDAAAALMQGDMAAMSTDRRENSPSDSALPFYQILAETPLFLLLASEPKGEDLTPLVFALASGPVVLAFDSEDRMGAWAQSVGQGALPYAVLPGRILAGLIAGQDAGQASGAGLALGLNFGAQSPSEMILPQEAMQWLMQMLDVSPAAKVEKIAQVLPMGAAPPALLNALAQALQGAGGVAQRAVLARVAYVGGAQAHVLAFFGVAEAAQPPLARAVAEALAFSGLEAAALDVIFPSLAPQAGRSVQLMLERGQDIPLPKPAEIEPPAPRPAPGMDQSAPPKLR